MPRSPRSGQNRRRVYRSRGGSTGERLQGLGQGLQGLGQSIGTFIYLQNMLKNSRTPEEKAKIQEKLLAFKANIDMMGKQYETMQQTGAPQEERMKLSMRMKQGGLGAFTTEEAAFPGPGEGKFPGQPDILGGVSREVAGGRARADVRLEEAPLGVSAGEILGGEKVFQEGLKRERAAEVAQATSLEAGKTRARVREEFKGTKEVDKYNLARTKGYLVASGVLTPSEIQLAFASMNKEGEINAKAFKSLTRNSIDSMFDYMKDSLATMRTSLEERHTEIMSLAEGTYQDQPKEKLAEEAEAIRATLDDFPFSVMTPFDRFVFVKKAMKSGVSKEVLLETLIPFTSTEDLEGMERALGPPPPQALPQAPPTSPASQALQGQPQPGGQPPPPRQLQGQPALGPSPQQLGSERDFLKRRHNIR